MLSNTAVAAIVVEWLLTTIPASSVLGMFGIVLVVPICLKVLPSVEKNALKSFPTRVRRRYVGTALLPEERSWTASVPAGVRTCDWYRAPAIGVNIAAMLTAFVVVNPSRIMMPTSASVLGQVPGVPPQRLARRTVNEPSPVIDLCTKKNESDEPPMSLPPPVMLIEGPVWV